MFIPPAYINRALPPVQIILIWVETLISPLHIEFLDRIKREAPRED
jgi:hypothetical protein